MGFHGIFHEIHQPSSWGTPMTLRTPHELPGLQAVRRAQAQLSEVLQTLPEEDRQVERGGISWGGPGGSTLKKVKTQGEDRIKRVEFMGN